MTTETETSHSAMPIFINRDYAFLWSGQAVSSLGDSMYDLTLVVWIAAVISRQANGQPASWAPLAVSGVLVAVALPSLLFGPIAGVFVDRWNKKQTLLLADFLRGLLILFLIAFSGLSFLPWKPTMYEQLGAIYLTVFLASICSQFFTPARAVLIGDIVGKDQLGRASGLAQTSQSIAMIMGPPLAAPVLFSFGVQWALLFNAFSFLVSFVCVRAVNAPVVTQNEKQGKTNFRREFFEGIAFSFQNRVLQVLFVVVFVASLAAGAINSLMVFFVPQNLHVSITNVGLLDGFFGVGIIAGSVIVSALASKIQMTQIFTSAILSFGILFLLFARSSNIILALGLLVFLGLAQAAINIAIVPIALATVPREMLGRSLGTLNPLGMVASLISVSLSGYLASSLFRNIQGSFLGIAFGPIDTIFTIAALLFLVSGLYALIQLRSLPTASSGENAK